MSARAFRRLLTVLLAVTAIALAWNRFGMNTSLVIDGRSPYRLAVLDDRTAGGRSTGTPVRDGSTMGMDCRIERGAAQPSCELLVTLREAPGGIDLSRFDRLRLWISASGPEARPRVQVSFRSFDPASSRVGAGDSEKVDQLVFEPAAYPSGYEVPLGRFAVAPGWIDAHPAAADPDTPDFRNVTTLAFSTGPAVVPGLHKLRIDRVELQGKEMPAATFRLLVIAAWMLAGLAWLVADALAARSQLRLSVASQHSLQRLNESLRLETRHLAEVARTDPLTGVLNRKGLADELARVVRANGERAFPLALVFIDVDHLRRINEEHGHDLGDQVIRGLAELVRGAIEREDLFARWGGEEFLLVFRDTPGHEGRDIAEDLRDRIAAAHWPAGLRVTCSFGVAEWRHGEELNEGVQRADEAMYRAKQNGRDRVEVELALDDTPESEPSPA